MKFGFGRVMSYVLKIYFNYVGLPERQSRLTQTSAYRPRSQCDEVVKDSICWASIEISIDHSNKPTSDSRQAAHYLSLVPMGCACR
jgi:hypothetical protein